MTISHVENKTLPKDFTHLNYNTPAKHPILYNKGKIFKFKKGNILTLLSFANSDDKQKINKEKQVKIATAPLSTSCIP